jgi:cell division protein FtsW (lipid II flippase)
VQNILEYHSQPGYINFIRIRLTYLAIIFISLNAIGLSLASFIRNKSLLDLASWQHWIGYFVWLGLFLLVTQVSTRLLPHQDPYVIDLIYICCGWSLMILWRLSPNLGMRQTAWFIIGSITYLAILRFPQILAILKRYTYIWLSGAFLLIILTLLPGLLNGSNQPKLWLSFQGLTLQPSEPFKLIFIVYLSAYFSRKLPVKIGSLAVIIPTVVVAMSAILVLLAQKDLGTVSLMMAIYVVMVFIGTGDRKFLFGSIIIFIAAFISGYFLFDVIRLRVGAWINPWIDPVGRSYQIVQALISQASGGILGTGPGMGSPNLVPVAASDFIYSAIAEESGLLGAVAVILLLVLITFRGFSIALRAKDKFNALLCTGISFWIAAQGLMIIGGNIRLLPLTGVTLPFFSYGGSSLVICMIAGSLVTLISGQSDDSPDIQLSKKQIYFDIILPIILFVASLSLLLLPVWSFILKDQLTSRSDNLRRAIADTNIARGEILDRNGDIINGTKGSPGDYSRSYFYPPLAATVGYSNISFGQSGLEAILDPYLRGLKSYPPFTLWWNNLLFSHPPPGSNVRLSIDLSLQNWLDTQLDSHTGSIVVMNAESGELLAVVSHPWFDPNQLESEWSNIITDPRSPLLNRALVGKYPPGTSLGPFLMGKAIDANLQLPSGSNDTIAYKNRTINCAIPPVNMELVLGETVQRGCPQSNLNIGRIIGKNGLYDLFSNLGFYASPDFIFSAPESVDPTSIDNIKAASIGQENLSLTPLQMVLATSSISSGGEIPTPYLALSYQLPSGNWELLQPESSKHPAFSEATANNISSELSNSNLPAWSIVGQALSSNTQTITWFLGGTNTNWRGVPVSFVVLLEEDNAQLAIQIGDSIASRITSIQEK